VATELWANNPSTTVTAGGTTPTDTAWTVASSALFPAATSAASTQFHVVDPRAPSELVAVTSVSGTSWTVTRGAEGTTAVGHAPGFTVQQTVSAGQLSAFTGTAGLAVLTGGGTISSSVVTAAQNAGFNGIFLDPRYVWDASGLVFNGVSNFVIESRMVGSAGFNGAVAYNTGGYIQTSTGSQADGIQVYSSNPTGGAGNATQGIWFRGCVFVGGNSGAVVHYGGGQRRCGMENCLAYNTHNTATTVASGSNGVNVSTFTGTQSLSVGNTSAFPSTGSLLAQTSGGVALISYGGISGNTFTNCTTAGGTGTLSSTSGSNKVQQASFAVVDDTALSANNSEDQTFRSCTFAGQGAGAAIGIDTGSTSQHANDTLWDDVVTSSGGLVSIAGLGGGGHNFINYYDRSSPTVATVWNGPSGTTSCTMIFTGGEDLNNLAANGVAHLLTGSSSATVCQSRNLSVGANTVTATVNAGSFIARGRCRWSGTVSVAGGTVDLSDSSGAFSGLTISGSTGTVALAANYNPGSAPVLTSWTGTITSQFPVVAASARGTGQTLAQTLSWTPPTADCRVRVSLQIHATTAGTSTVPNLAYTELGGTTRSYAPAMWNQAGGTVPTFSITDNGLYLGQVTFDTDASGAAVVVTVTPTGSTFRWSAVIERIS